MSNTAPQKALTGFRPYLIGSMHGYSMQRLTKDVSAGATVGIVALPLAMAFAMASGLKPEAGIFTAIIAGFLISALGGSRVQIGGPAGASSSSSTASWSVTAWPTSSSPPPCRA